MIHKLLKERFQNWLDWDVAAYELGACLGFWPEFGEYPEDLWSGVKWVMWSQNPLGEGLNNFLEALVLEGALEKRSQPDIAYRWNPNYDKVQIIYSS